jgi:Tol biopolymer transport system component
MKHSGWLPVFLLLSVGVILGACGQVAQAPPETATERSISPTPEAAAELPLQPTPTTITLPSPTPEATACKKIAFVMTSSAPDGGQDIYTICPDGNGLARLTDHPAGDFSPVWSPDGDRIAFVSDRSGAGQVYVVQADGGDPAQVTFDFENSAPIWLPDGEHIAVLTTDGAGLWWWRIAALDGPGEIVQWSEPSYDFFYPTPAWSPDGSQIAYMSLEEQKLRNDGASQIHVRDAAGGNDRALTADTWANVKPTWSPDGRMLAFLSERDGTFNSYALYVIDVDGSDLRRLTEPHYDAESPVFSWSPDGEQIAISSLLDGQIYIVSVADGSMRPLYPAQDGEDLSSPSWQP